MKPTLGRIVLYVLTAADAETINASRGDELTPQRGNHAAEGQIFPSMVVAVWGEGENPPINLKVQLDGTDTYWATSRLMSDDKTPGTWHWMEHQKQVAGIAAGCVGTAFGAPSGLAALPAANGEPIPVDARGNIMDRPIEERSPVGEAPAESTDPVKLADAEGQPLDVAPEQTPEELEKLKEEVGF